MIDGRDFRKLLKEIAKRTRSDESLSRAIKELEDLQATEEKIGLADDAPHPSAGRARLPYSSDPVTFDEQWN